MLEGKARVEDTAMPSRMQATATSAASRALDLFDIVDCRAIAGHIKAASFSARPPASLPRHCASLPPGRRPPPRRHIRLHRRTIPYASSPPAPHLSASSARRLRTSLRPPLAARHPVATSASPAAPYPSAFSPPATPPSRPSECLVPAAAAVDAKVFYLKMKGDYHRYLAEFKTGAECKDAADATLTAYQAAQVSYSFPPLCPRAMCRPTSHGGRGCLINKRSVPCLSSVFTKNYFAYGC
ncbi:hypothetical protein GUJ93_ZPchr0006g44418 [Zizania palustris]|uniref:14-3-3 domain-containing protein n=1 Tax=Zizania palustris TaxID=103762 RepID=A0A8J5W2H4_ZIZPA|nr:hypothetical protein GUJ93_ZPchr0006g44418 [Zizania palustris]